jgi:tetratricopeptide (TPR) repeat protein
VKSKNDKFTSEGVDEQLAAGGLAPEDLGKFYFYQGQFAYQAQNYAKAEQAFDLSVQNHYSDPNLYPLVAETKSKLGKKQEALAAIQSGIAAMKAANQPVPQDWYQSAVRMAYDGKLAPQATSLTQDWVSAYPSKTNWRDSLVIYRDVSGPDSDTNLDIMRLMRAIGCLTGQADYMEYVQTTYLKYPGEAKGVLEEGIAAGALSASNASVKEMLGIVSGKIASDRASLAASKNPSTGRAAMLTGDAFLGYKDYAAAIDLYKQALAKGGADANVVNIRLALAYAQSGQKDLAKQALASVTGPRAGLAKYYAIWIDQKA